MYITKGVILTGQTRLRSSNGPISTKPFDQKRKRVYVHVWRTSQTTFWCVWQRWRRPYSGHYLYIWTILKYCWMYVYVLTIVIWLNLSIVWTGQWTTVCDHRMGLFSSSDIHLWADACHLESEGVGYYRNGPNARSENHKCANGARWRPVVEQCFKNQCWE